MCAWPTNFGGQLSFAISIYLISDGNKVQLRALRDPASWPVGSTGGSGYLEVYFLGIVYG